MDGRHAGGTPEVFTTVYSNPVNDNPEAMQRDLDDAWGALAARRVVAEFETRPVTGAEPLPAVPSWNEYQRTLSGDEAGV